MAETTTFTYLEWQNKYQYEKPYQIFTALSDTSFPLSNLVFRDGSPERVQDARGREDSFDLDSSGFAFRKDELPPGGFESSEWVETEYFARMEEVLRNNLSDVGKVHFFDWRIRRNIEMNQGVIDASDKLQHFLPARHVHIDQTPSAVIGRIKLHLPDEAEQLLMRRVRVINLWRPLVDVVEDRPLAICDLRTVSPDDLVDADHVRKHYSGSNYYLKPSDEYSWHYLSRQKRDEITLIQMFDSTKDGVSGKSDH